MPERQTPQRLASRTSSKGTSRSPKGGKAGGAQRDERRSRPGRTLPEPVWRLVLAVLVLAVLLFAIMLRGEHILVTSASGTAVAAIQVALFLTSILQAGLMLGAAGGIGAVRLMAGPDGTALVGARGRRALLALLGGLVVGIVGGAAAYLLESDLTTSDGLTVGVCIAVAGLVGGAIAALRPGMMITAGLAGTVVVLVVLALRSLFISPLTRLFGGEGTVTKYATAQDRLALVSFLVAGALAGVAVHIIVRRAGNRLGTAANMAAGGTAGGLALLAQVLTWFGAAKLVTSAGGLDLGDQYAFAVAGRYQVIGSMGLLFAGALVAVVLYGRTVPNRRSAAPAKKPAAKPDWAIREEKKAAAIDKAAREKAAREKAARQKAASPKGASDTGASDTGASGKGDRAKDKAAGGEAAREKAAGGKAAEQSGDA